MNVRRNVIVLLGCFCLGIAVMCSGAFAEPMSLQEAVRQNKVSVQVNSLGGATGNTVRVGVRRKVPEKVEVKVTPGTVFIAKSGKVQSKAFVDRHVVWHLVGTYTLDACQHCTDAQCDVADVSFGDPWGHPIDQEALKAGIGYSCALVRTQKADDFISSARKAGAFRFFKEIIGSERDFLGRTEAMITKCYGRKSMEDERERHGLPRRVVS